MQLKLVGCFGSIWIQNQARCCRNINYDGVVLQAKQRQVLQCAYLIELAWVWGWFVVLCLQVLMQRFAGSAQSCKRYTTLTLSGLFRWDRCFWCCLSLHDWLPECTGMCSMLVNRKLYASMAPNLEGGKSLVACHQSSLRKKAESRTLETKIAWIYSKFAAGSCMQACSLQFAIDWLSLQL